MFFYEFPSSYALLEPGGGKDGDIRSFDDQRKWASESSRHGLAAMSVFKGTAGCFARGWILGGEWVRMKLRMIACLSVANKDSQKHDK